MPEVAGRGWGWAADADRQFAAEATEGDREVFCLGAAFTGLDGGVAGSMHKDDGGFDLIPILPPGTRTPRARDLALGQERVAIKGRGVHAPIVVDCGWERLRE